MANTYTFPQNFYWGSATSAPQSEGTISGDGKGKSLWDGWFALEPGKFHNGIGPNKTSTFYENYRTDIDFLKKTGHNSFRPSISWSRLIPKGYGEVNPEAIIFYRDVFERLIAQGVEPIVNLYHFDMPWCLQEIGGFENRQVVEYYAQYAKTCFELFGDIVKRWFTFNEPIVPVEAGYLYQFHYPNRVDPKAACRVGYYTQLASSRAIEEYRKLGQNGKIGIVLNLTPTYARSSNRADIQAAEIADVFFNKAFLDPAVKGVFPDELVKILAKHNVLPEYTADELAVIKENTVDFLGVNYYQPRRVKARENLPNPEAPFFPEYYFDTYDMPGKVMNPHRGWEIYPKGIYDLAINIRDNYGNIEWMISENGMGVEGEEKFIVDGVVQDDYRIEFYENHLAYLHQAIEEGSFCIGYHVWTFIDCWSWTNAYKNRYGLVALDLKTQQKTIKKSGHWFKKVSEQNGF
ncbi:cryptic 6-phospho-beta-glucosidase [Erysipelotrichaceae bacterium]|nr:cryptic 6-phospho-beta-glucosidase [Erysipelotrichaceae bacterium]